VKNKLERPTFLTLAKIFLMHAVSDLPNLEIGKLGRRLAVLGFLQGQKRIEDLRFLSAAERYKELLEKYPGITNRISLKHLSSYLGTTQVSLSRIRGGKQ
jgi:hypothetical protein